VLGSRKQEAKDFKRWITHEVIPQIRKTGGYHLPQTYAEALRAYADKVEQNEKLAAENAKLLPKAEFFDAVTDSKSAISIGEVAKVLDVGIGQNKLFAFLRDRKILDRQNIPYQEYIDRGYFRTIEQKYDVRGEVRISIKTLVFQKGIDFIRKQLQKEEV
jgi:phage antirepressor YoqD-like protein